jgi:hypothetical protein
MPFNLYIRREYQTFMDQLVFISTCNKSSLSKEIGKAIKTYVQNLNSEKPLIADSEDWDKYLENATKEELYEMSRVICGINDRLIRKVMSK